MSSTIIRPLSGLNLKSWDSGRLSTLKLAISRLEEAANKSLAASSLQASKRTVTNKIPFPINVTVNPGFRQAEINFPLPPGLGNHPERQLLFYEIQHDSSAAFPNPETLTSPQRHIVISGLSPGEVRSFRVRVVSTLNKVGPWSQTKTVQLAFSPIQITRLVNTIKGENNGGSRLNKSVGNWQIIFEGEYQPVDAFSTINAHVALATPHFDVQKRLPNNTLIKTLYGGPAFVQFRLKVGSFNSITGTTQTSPIGERFILSARPGYANTNDRNSIKTPLAFGSIPSPWFEPSPGIQAKVIIEAALMPGSEWKGSSKSRSLQTSNPIVFVKNVSIIESLKSA